MEANNVAHIYINDKHHGYLLNVADEAEVRTWLVNHYEIKQTSDPSVRVEIREA